MENVASRFGQRLAHTEKKYRDQALKKLSAYLAKRTQWSALEWDKLWKALFYCMWMSDKRAVQDELSTNLSRLVHTIPAVDDALGFCHSFFRTMHREWHGIDGLRLDKFYSLIRKFVHETLLLLRHHDWDRALVERVVSILSSEIMSQLPNGLRLHVTDLFLTELHGAAGDDVDTATFLLLLEPFFTLLSSEYDKTVFKRVRELVFLPMLSTYAFGPQPEKGNKKTESDELHDTDKEDDGDDEDAPKVFAEVELPFVQHRIFAIASAEYVWTIAFSDFRIGVC
jgi:ribosomal RNA-processing protein 1